MANVQVPLQDMLELPGHEDIRQPCTILSSLGVDPERRVARHSLLWRLQRSEGGGDDLWWIPVPALGPTNPLLLTMRACGESAR